MLDETIITETPPLTACYGPRGEQVEVPVTGHHARRVLHGVLNIHSGGVLFLITEAWDQQTHQAFLNMMRLHWSGWHIVLFEDRSSPHTAATRRRHAKALGIEVRFLPRATPELNAMDHLWRYVKGRLLANRATQTIHASADAACQALLAMSRHERLRKAGVLSGHFWLAP
jgi:transposase